MKKKFVSLAVVLLMLYSTVIMTFASGGPAADSGSASVTNTAGTGSSYSFDYAYDSTYHGSLSSERPNVTTKGANASVTFTGNTFTIIATSSAGENPWGSWSDKSAQNVSTDVSITNNSQSTLKIGYTYSVSGGVTTGSDLATGSGTLTWLPGQSISLTVKTTVTAWTAASSTATATFKITSCEEVDEYDLNVYPSVFGTYTYTVGSDVSGTLTAKSEAFASTASNSDIVTLSIPVLDAAFTNDYVFYGWSVNGVVTASDTAYSGAVTTHTTIFPVVVKKDLLDVSGNGPFYVNGKYYSFWREAFLAAGTSYPVVLARDYTLPTTLQENGVAVADGKYIGVIDDDVQYIVPANSTLLIPYDTANTLITDNMGDHVLLPADAGAQSLYRQLTMPSGANITVANGGSINVGSRANRQMTGQVGAYGAIKMDSGSSITVGNGGTLYAWGYITHGANGGGTITVQNGGAVHEMLMTMDYPGSASSTLDLFNKNGIFPLRTFTVRNVEVPMTLMHGAKEYGFYHFYGTTAGEYPGTINFVGNDSSFVFQTTANGSLTKSYVSGKQKITSSGNASLNSIAITIKNIFEYDVNSGQTSGFPVPSGYDLEVASGTFTLNENVILLEGSKITIAEGATVNTNGKNVYVFDASDDAGSVSVKDVHGTAYSKVDKDAIIDVNGTVNVSGGFYTSAGKASIISSGDKGVINITAVSSDTSVAIKTSTRAASTYNVTPAYLQHSNGNYVQSEEATFKHANGFWHKGCDGSITTTTNPATCTENGSKTTKCACGIINKTETISASGHTPGAAATCTSAQTCTVCGEVINPASGHVWNKENICENDSSHKLVAQVYNYSTTTNDAGEVVESWTAGEKYMTLADALSKVRDKGYIVMLNSSDAETEITGTVYIDLNGKDIINLTVSGTLYGMDSATNDLGVTNTYGEITGTITETGSVETVFEWDRGAHAGNTYVKIVDEETQAISFHRIRFGVDSYTYYTKGSSVMDVVDFSATYLGDGAVLNAITALGMNVDGTPKWYHDTEVTTDSPLSNYTSDAENSPTGFVLKGHATGVTEKITVKAMLQISGKTLLNETDGYYVKELLLGTLQGG